MIYLGGVFLVLSIGNYFYWLFFIGYLFYSLGYFLAGVETDFFYIFLFVEGYWIGFLDY